MTVNNNININTDSRRGNRSTFVAYILWLLFGGLGFHRFYLGYGGSGFVQLLLFALGFVTVYTFAVLALWLFIDMFLIPGMAR